MATAYSTNKHAGNRPKIQSPENFLEALRGLGQSTMSEISSQAKSAIFQDVPESLGISSPTGTLNPNESLSLNDLRQAERSGYQKAETEFSQRLSQMHQAERTRLLQNEAAAKQQIQSIREEISNLAKSLGDFAQEVQVATQQAPVNPGIYHKNFYAHLKSLIVSLRTRVESSKNWLSATNSRAKKQNFYWSQVGKSGTKFMLSSERYMVTSTG